LGGVDGVIVERRASQDVEGTRARGLHARTHEVLDQRGRGRPIRPGGQAAPVRGVARSSLDISGLPTRHNYLLGLFQGDFERILAGWVLDELGVPVLRGCEVMGFVQDDGGVDVELSGDRRRRAQHLVGCDGGHSLIWKAAGIDPVDRAKGGGPYRVVLVEKHLGRERDPTLEDVREALVASYGTDYGVHSPTWISRFTDTCRQAAPYREGRVLLAGDAAHVHGPQGGQGLNIGVQDAVNLGWKLAQVVKGISTQSLRDTTTPNDTRSARCPTSTCPLPTAPRASSACCTTPGPCSSTSANRASDLSPWGNRIRSVDAKPTGGWELPVLGPVPPTPAVAIRPDGHVAWAGHLTDPGLPRALTTWFGPPTPT
jgi:3-(3-hydroxy-phenyl)propionate hydroxylase